MGDLVTALPSGRSSRITSITTFEGDLEEASTPLSIAVTLENELDISRGDLLCDPQRPPQRATLLEASLVWFDNQRLDTFRTYLLKHGSSMRNARVKQVVQRTNVHTLAAEAVNGLGMNDIGIVEIELTLPLFFDAYAENRTFGSFILIDPQNNATLAAGMIRRGLSSEPSSSQAREAVLLIASDARHSRDIEERLVAEGAQVVRTRTKNAAILRNLLALGLVVLVEEALPAETLDVLTAAGIAPGRGTSYQPTKTGEHNGK